MCLFSLKPVRSVTRRCDGEPVGSIVQPAQIMAIPATIRTIDRLHVAAKSLRCLPTMVLHVPIRERKVASLIMPVCWHFAPNVRSYGKNAVVNALFMFIDEDEDLARSVRRILLPS